MEATETVTVTHENTPNGVVETRETTVSHDEGDITESWLRERFDEIRDAVVSQVSEQMSRFQSEMTEASAQLLNRVPSNLVELLSQQQSTITSLTNQLTELATRLLTPQPAAVVVPTPEPDVSAEVTPEPVVVAAPVEPPRRKLRIV